MDNTAELAELRKEVATLKQQMAELKRFLRIERHAATPETPATMGLNISCSGLTLRDPIDERNIGQTRGGFCIENNAPVLFLWGENKARALLEVKENKPSLRLLHDNLKAGVVACIDKKDEACVIVYDHGKPRGMLKGMRTGGLVSVTHDDGLARATLTADTEYGAVSVVNADMKVVGQLTSRSVHGEGGGLLLHTPTGKLSVVLMSTPHSGFVAVHDPTGKVVASLPGPQS